MEQCWQKLRLIQAEAKPEGLWNLVIDYVPGSRLLRFTVVSHDEQGDSLPTRWSPVSGTDCGPNGLHCAPPKTGLLHTAAMYGALIAKVGGSTADIPDSSSNYMKKLVFAVGSYCVIFIGSTEGGPLFLTMNDNPANFPEHTGVLHVLIEECLI